MNLRLFEIIEENCCDCKSQPILLSSIFKDLMSCWYLHGNDHTQHVVVSFHFFFILSFSMFTITSNFIFQLSLKYLVNAMKYIVRFHVKQFAFTMPCSSSMCGQDIHEMWSSLQNWSVQLCLKCSGEKILTSENYIKERIEKRELNIENSQMFTDD